MGVNTFQLSSVTSGAEIPPDQWARLAARPALYNSRAWYELTETPPPGEGAFDSRYLLADSGPGRLAGILPTYQIRAMTRHGYDPSVLVTDLLPPALRTPPAWLPSLCGGGIGGYRTDLLVDPTLPAEERRRVLASLLDVVLSTVDEHRLRGPWRPYLTTADAMLVTDILGADCPPPVLLPPAPGGTTTPERSTSNTSICSTTNHSSRPRPKGSTLFTSASTRTKRSCGVAAGPAWSGRCCIGRTGPWPVCATGSAPTTGPG